MRAEIDVSACINAPLNRSKQFCRDANIPQLVRNSREGAIND
jgi:hypothetical protein